MKPDHPTIERIRKARHDISARFGHDTRRMVDYYLELQRNTPPERFCRPVKQEAEQIAGANGGDENDKSPRE